MKKNRLQVLLFSLAILFALPSAMAQNPRPKPVYKLSDTLRGTLTPERTWWDVQRYDVTIKADFATKSTQGSNRITYKVVKNNSGAIKMQIDLKAPLKIEKVVYNDKKALKFEPKNGVWYISMPAQKNGEENSVTVYFNGKPQEAVRPPWEGGWSFKTDSLNRPWMTVTCQGGAGASIWYPNKDHQSDEPNNGASLTMIVPDNLVGVANGKLEYKRINGDGTTSYKWNVINPINNYCLIPYIGSYVNFKEVYAGEKGNLDLDYWVLDYNLEKAKNYLPKQVKNMLKSFEHWFGPYPFYEDGFKLVDVNYPGMEHQSAVSYGNQYKYGYGGRDQSGTGWGLLFDFIVIHESGHEWFGNNITTNDLADMWVHEGFTNYSETLFVDYIFGKDAADAYNHGIRRGIRNDKPIIPEYSVNAQGSGDMYPKASNMIHSIRHSVNDDVLFRDMLRSMNKDFYHQTVNSSDIENYISQKTKFNYSKVFDQYLRNTSIPNLEYYFSRDRKKVFFRYTNCIKGFNLPLTLKNPALKIKIFPTDEWSSYDLKANETDLFNPDDIVKQYYIGAKQVQPISN